MPVTARAAAGAGSRRVQPRQQVRRRRRRCRRRRNLNDPSISSSLRSGCTSNWCSGWTCRIFASLPPDTVRAEVRVLIRELCQSEKGLINSADQERLMDEVMDETFGLGPLEALLKDPTISDIMVNRFDRIYVEQQGPHRTERSALPRQQHLRQIIDRIVGLVGRRVDETSPMVDARLADGSRVNAIIPPLALDGPAMSIRRFGSKPMQAGRPDPRRRLSRRR